MIKYADRGLIEGGQMNPLFETLYLVIGGVLSTFFLVLFSVDLSRSMKRTETEKNGRPYIMEICTLGDMDNASFNKLKNAVVPTTVVGVLLLICIFMFNRYLF